MKSIILLLCVLTLVGILASCARASDKTQEQTKQNEIEVSFEDTKESSDAISLDKKETMEQTGYTIAVPSSYKTASGHPGTVTRLDYDSKDYIGDESAITKTAYVYTPYGYDENDEETRYNIVYLMHGWGGHAGEYFEYSSTKNMFDHLIENGEIPPVIIVSATFYNKNSNTDFSSSIAEFRQFHRDFEENLMPAVEGRFHTYAKSVSDEDLKASRDHRAFGGFSLGSVTTWLQFCYDTDYIRYFLPMSGSCWYYGTYGDFQIERNVDFIEQLVKDNGLDERGYFIYHAVGTNDAVKSQSIDMAEVLQKMIDADVIVLSSPVYFYSIDAQLKTVIDRTVARWTEIKNKEFYYIVTCADGAKASQETTIACFRGFADCVEGAMEKGIIYGTGVYKPGEIRNSPACVEAYDMGKSVKGSVK